MSEVWIILGASSAMARAFSRKAASEGASLVLAGRDLDDLTVLARDLVLRGAPAARPVTWDARDPATFASVLETAQSLGQVQNAAVFAGSMPPQADIDANPALMEGVIADSFLGPARFLHLLAPVIEANGAGVIVGVGSVAGDRGRIKNYVYGAAKAGFHTYLSGVRNRLTRAGGHVVTVKPGFVDTAMSWGHPGMFLVAAPDEVSDAIWTAVRKRRNEIYTPFFWRYIMLIIRNIPEFLFKKMSI